MATLALLVVAGATAAAAQEECHSTGSVAGAAIGGILATLIVVALGYVLWRLYWRSRRGKHLVLVTDPEGGGVDQYAFDNPCFRDGTPISKAGLEKEGSKLDSKARWSAWTPLGAFVTTRSDKRKALDDSCIGEPKVNVVSLRSHDFTGLGFNICGNMRDGIFVKDVLHRGPASESGRITPGDRVASVRICFRHMVFEDALTILSYASPYEVQLELEDAAASRPSTLARPKRASGTSVGPGDRICHPFYRSQSIADLAQIGKDSQKRGQTLDTSARSPRTPTNESFNESSAGEYPTLKLSTPQSSKGKENIKLEQSAATSSPEGTITKPERAKRVSREGKDSPDKADTLSRFQKFGVRVLPDPGVPVVPRLSPQGNTDTGRLYGDKSGKKLPAQPEHHQNEQNSIIERVKRAPPGDNSQHHSSEVVDEVDSSASTTKVRESNSVTYDERGIDVGPDEMKRQRTAGPQNHKATEDEESSHVKVVLSKGLQNVKEKSQPHDRSRYNLENEGHERPFSPERDYREGQIPTEIPEEVRRAAMAARSNRKSSGNSSMAVAPDHSKLPVIEKLHTNSESGDSSSEGDTTQPLGSDTPRKPHKRKAPPPPEDIPPAIPVTSNSKSDQTPMDGSEMVVNVGSDSQTTTDADKEFVSSSITNMASIRQQRGSPDSSSKDTTGTTDEGPDVRPLTSSAGTLESSDDNSASRRSLEFDEVANVSDSDSDIDQSEGDSMPGRVKRGGTTIELNASHITVHHGPSDQDDGSRKAASLGDLSHLDSEAPILERAVSLDLDGAPHGPKKRKAPPPPPGELALPDSDELYRKEPRLDGMDTFQRRLKKSSDWGTLEEALQQNDSDVTSHKQNLANLDICSTVLNPEISGKGELQFIVGKEVSHSGQVSRENLSNSMGMVHNFYERDPIISSTSNQFHQMSNPANDHSDSAQQKMVVHISPEPGSSLVTIGQTSRYTTDISEMASSPLSTQHHMVSSTPLFTKAADSTALTGVVSSTTQKEFEKSLQSPLISSWNTSINLSSPDLTRFSELDLSAPATSAIDHFVTAVDTTTNTLEDEEDPAWVQDSPPPELPTSPVPLMNMSLPTKPNSSMTYITEIQVLTTNNSEKVKPSVVEFADSTDEKYESDLSLSSDSIGSGGDEQEMEAIMSGNMQTSQPIKNNISVTSIRSVERSKIPTRVTNHTEEKKKPPVTPRKSSITVQVPSSQTRDTRFVSFSSLAPRAEEPRHSSFEQWVFLDDGKKTPYNNGLETTTNGESRSQSVTHIVLDAKPTGST